MLAATRSTTGRGATPRRPRVGVVKFASCDGCQLTLLDLEDELLDLVTTFDLVEFAEATSHRSSGPFDVAAGGGLHQHARPDRGDHPHPRARPRSW